MRCRSYRAEWVLPISGPPLHNAVIEVSGERIVDVRRANRDDGGPAFVDLGNVAVLPALVNAHTHLEFSGLQEPLEPRRDFAKWIRAVIAFRRGRSGDMRPVLKRGGDEAAQSGTGVLGEIATEDGLEQYGSRQPGTTCVVFREVLGLDDRAIDAQVNLARGHLEHETAPGIVTGLSPHAPYSVHPELLKRCIDVAVARSSPVAMHVAESEAEAQLLHRGTGPLADLLQGLGVWREGLFPSRLTWLDMLRELSRAPQALVVHGNLLVDAEIEFLATQSHMSVVYCPRTHATMGHPPHPWRRLLAAGVRVALGTDSRASNPDLSLIDEVRFLHRLAPDVPSSTLLEMATRYGAQALGVDRDYGTLEPGKLATFSVINLPGTTADEVDIEHQVLSKQSQVSLRIPNAIDEV